VPIKLGLWTPLPHTIREEPEMQAAVRELTTPGGSDTDRSFRFGVDVVQAAESYGFKTTLIAERLLGPDLEAWMFAAALAPLTKHIELMVAVHPGIVTPQMVAKMGATLDRISGGRFAVNLVNGWWQQEFNLFSNGGWSPDERSRYQRMDEFAQVIKGLWTQQSQSFKGEFYQFEDGYVPTKVLQLPNPPIYAGSRSEIGKETVAKYCDWWFVYHTPNYRLFEENLTRIITDIVDMKARAGSYGRRLQFGMSAHVVCADTMAEARSQAEELEAYAKRDRLASVVGIGLGAGLVGTPELVAERIRRYEAAGVECLLLYFHPMKSGLINFCEQIVPMIRRCLA
jgi:FMNH2-dependent dimethyl sulfone monooxygenase